jgi:hypothetical protein
MDKKGLAVSASSASFDYLEMWQWLMDISRQKLVSVYLGLILSLSSYLIWK